MQSLMWSYINYRCISRVAKICYSIRSYFHEELSKNSIRNCVCSHFVTNIFIHYLIETEYLYISIQSRWSSFFQINFAKVRNKNRNDLSVVMSCSFRNVNISFLFRISPSSLYKFYMWLAFWRSYFIHFYYHEIFRLIVFRLIFFTINYFLFFIFSRWAFLLRVLSAKTLFIDRLLKLQ